MNPQRKITVAIADDHKIFRDGMRMALKDKDCLEILWEAEDGKDLIHKLSLKLPDVILMDIRMPEVDGIGAIMVARKKYESLKIIVLTMYDDPEMITTMMELGANAYLTKTTDPEEVYQAILTCMNDDFYFNELVNKAVLLKLQHKKTVRQFYPNPVKLTEKELKILKLIVDDKTTEDISREVFLSPRTIETIRQNMKQKVGVKTIAGLVKYAIETGIRVGETSTNQSSDKVYNLSLQQMAKLFSLSTSILLYINHDLSGQRGILYYALTQIKEASNKNKKEKAKSNDFGEINSLVEKALDATRTITSIIDVIKSHFYWRNAKGGPDFNTLFISRPIQIIENIRRAHKGITIKIHRTSLKSLEIIYPPQILQAILSELIENAKKMNQTNLKILIKWKIQGNIFQCEVHDNGPGFRDMKCAKFVPIESILSGLKGKSPGIGLSIINRTILDSDGHLFFSGSKALNGALVYFEFPVFDYKYKIASKDE